MKFPLSWIKEYLDINASATEIAKILTSIGIEVDGIQPQSSGFDNVVVATVIDTVKHPNADKLCIATVTDGSETYQVVCGASNCRKGLKTAFAKAGATLYDRSGKAFKIKLGKIRDVESQGMLCSEDELLVSDESDGIIEFAEQIPLGADVAEIYSDMIFEVSLTPNLGHCMSVLGIAKELSASTEIPIKKPLIKLEESTLDASSQMKICIESKDKAPFYSCRLLQGIKMQPSPDWMQKRLKACGFRPINAVVDVTNYVSLEYGQPLHAFDYNKLHGKEIIVKLASEGETFRALDGQEYQLQASDLAICDRMENGESRVIALAGIIGGECAEIDDKTESVLLESAYFDAPTIRRTSKRLSLHTDAARRFERNADPSAAPRALDRAVELLHEILGGSICKGVIQESSISIEDKRILGRLTRINSLLGTTLSASEVENALTRLGFSIKWDSQDVFSVDVPVGRADLNEEIDLVEEVARIYGYDNIPRVAAKYRSSEIPHAPIFLYEGNVRARMIAFGLQEVMTCNLIGPSILKSIETPLMPEEATIEVLNPTSQEQSILRTSLMPGLLQVAKYNYDHQNHDMALFEVGRIHFKEDDHYKEQSCVGILLTGRSSPHDWLLKPQEYDFFDVKGLVEDVLTLMQFPEVTFSTSDFKALHSGRQVSISIGDLKVGWMGEIHPSINYRLDVPQRMFFAEINLHDLYLVRGSERKIAELPLYPSSFRDWTVLLQKDIPIQPIFDVVKGLDLKFFETMKLLDLYGHENLGNDNQNVTFRFVYRNREKTIAQQEVDDEHAAIIKAIEQFVMKN